VTAGTLRQHAVAPRRSLAGLLFALYSGSLPPADDDQVWLLPDGNEPDVVAANCSARRRLSQHTPGVRCGGSVLGLSAGRGASIASPACTSVEGHLTAGRVRGALHG